MNSDTMTDEPSESGEDRLIARYFKPLATHPGAFGLVDDAAAITPPPGCDIVLKTDAIIGGVHFFPDDPPRTIAQKALRVNLSDLAAKGAKPLGCLLSIGLPSGLAGSLARGIFRWPRRRHRAIWMPAARRRYRALAGRRDGVGDRRSAPCRMAKWSGVQAPSPVTALWSPARSAMRRLGLQLRTGRCRAARWGLDQAASDYLAHRYLVPEPRNAIADILRTYATAAMDVSDGLAGDLAKLCRASGVSAEIDVARVPLSPAAHAALASRDPSLIEPILTNGDDYEVLASDPAGPVRRVLRPRRSGAASR